jgi:outer membrane protein insertion porin family
MNRRDHKKNEKNIAHALCKKYMYVFFALIIFTLINACSNTKYLPANDALYTGPVIKFDSASSLNKKKKKGLASDLASLTRPKPNSSILGLKIKLYAYNIAGHPKKPKSPRSWFKNKFGEAPVLLSSVNTDFNSKILQNYLQNKGYFSAEVAGDSLVKNKRAKAVYHVKTGVQYIIDSVVFPKDSSSLIKTINETVSETLLKKGNPFDLDVIKLERERIDLYLKQNGYYFFNPNYLLIIYDSTIGNHKVNLYVNVKQSTPNPSKQIWTINDVFVFSNYSLKSAAVDTMKSNARNYGEFYLADTNHLYKPRLFYETIKFAPGDYYDRRDHNTTISRFINLGLFKFVKNRFEPVPGIDSFKMNTYYYLTPLPKKSIHLEVNGNTKSDNLTGSQLSVGWRDRNTFRGGELLTIDAYGGFEVQYSSGSDGYNTYRAGLDTKLSFPRFLLPFFHLNTVGNYVPRTNVELGYDFLNKNRLYTLNSFKASFGYDWKENIKKEHQLNPIAITYVQPLNVTQEYKDSALTNPTLLNAIQKEFIIGSNYTFTYNELANGKQKKDAIYFNGNIDLSGNVIGLISGADTKAGKTVTIFGLDFSQYVKTEADFRYYHKVSGGTTWANRLDVGIGIPYGNSTALPFVKQFYEGGNNSLRGFRSRSVGPGTYLPAGTGTGIYIPDQSGDIKLEFNTELRMKLFSIVEGAVFFDAGNVWLYNADTSKPGAQFTSSFLSQLAADAGVGLRFNITILILRLDVAFPLRKPWLPAGQRWVLNQFDLSNSDWRKQNLVFNIGIGYPF